MIPTRISAVIFVLFLALPMYSSLSVSLSSPSEVKFNEPFSVTISADTPDTYDVKIYVKNSSDAVLSDIQNDSWKSSVYYVNNAFPSKTSFSLKVDRFSESAEICIKLRLSEKRSSPPTPEKCNSIKIIQSWDVPQPKQDNPSTNASAKDTGSQSETIPNSSSTANTSPKANNKDTAESKTTKNSTSKENTAAPSQQFLLSQNEIINQENINSDVNSEVITLSSKIAADGSNSEAHSYISPQQKTRLIALYSLTFLVLVVIILAMLKRL